MDDIRLGFEVYCGDDKVGEVARLIADARDSHITDLVVDRGLLHGAKLVPLEDIKGVQGQRVDLAISRDEFANADGFVDEKFRQPADDWSAPPGYNPTEFWLDVTVAEGGVGGYGSGGKPGPFPPSPADPRPNLLRPFIRVGTNVFSATGEKVGEIEQVSFHPDDGRLDHLVIKHGLLGHEHVQIPLDWVEGLDGDGLVLHVSKDEVEQLTEKS